MIQKDFCLNIIQKYNKHILIKTDLLNPILLLNYKTMRLFSTPYYMKHDKELIIKVRKNIDLVKKCLPE